MNDLIFLFTEHEKEQILIYFVVFTLSYYAVRVIYSRWEIEKKKKEELKKIKN